MKEIRKTEEVVTVKYEAVDGTIFDSKEECAKYDKSALAVLNAKFNKLIVGVYDAWNLMGGYDDNDVIAVKPQKEEDVYTILQRLLFDNSWAIDNKTEEWTKRIMKALEEDDCFLVGRNDEGVLYILDSINHYISQLKNITKDAKNK